jgi:hypothetical protein
VSFNIPAFAAGVQDTYGFGVRAMALGGAFTAVADDYSAVLYNPAGLAQREDNTIIIDYIFASPDISVKTLDGNDLVTPDIQTDPTESARGNGLDLPVPILAMNRNVNASSKLPRHVQLCMVYSFTGFRFETAYMINNKVPDQPNFIRYGNNADRVTMGAGAGIEAIEDLLYIGGGMQIMILGESRMYPSVGGGEQGIGQTVQPVKLVFDPIAGILLTPLGGKVKVGLSWRDEQLARIPVQISTRYMDLFDINVQAEIFSFFTPEEYSLGFAIDQGAFMVSLEANKQLWSRFKYSSSEQVYYEGSPDFKDTMNYRVGLELKPKEGTSIMAGYCHQPTPVPDQSDRVTNYLDMDKDIFSVGLIKTLSIKKVRHPVKIAGVFQYQKLDEYTVNKNGQDGPTWEDQQAYKVEGDVYAGGVSITLSY